MDIVELRRLCGEYLSRLKVTPEEIKAISRRTSKQSDDDSGEWESQRHGRLTASNFGDVCKRKEATKLALLTKRLLYGKKVNTKAMRYGMSNESQARRHYTDYIQNMSPDAKVEITGFHINQNDCWLGASPDGLVYDPISTDPHGLLEIKCPSRAEDTTLFDLCTKKDLKPNSFFMNYNHDTKTFSLKRSHVYYYQVQGQLQILNRSWCDFYVWTPRLDDIVVERIDRDLSFWNDHMFKKLKRFYMNSMLPELARPRHPSKQPIREDFSLEISSDC